MKRVFFLLTTFLCLHFSLQAQYPTAIGTKWEYFQFLDPYIFPNTPYWAFSDEVVSDTVVMGLTYQKVIRTGNFFSGTYLNYFYDPVDAEYFYRVDGSTVWVLDSANGSQAYESLLFEFGLNIGDTLFAVPKNIISLSPQSHSHYIMKYFELDTFCYGNPTCDTTHIYDEYIPFQGAFLPNCFDWQPYHNNYFLPGIGTIYSYPHSVILDVVGQYYHLGVLTSNGVILYKDSFIAAAIDDPGGQAFFTMYPNPVREKVSVRCKKLADHWEIFDLNGQRVMGGELNFPASEFDLQVPDLAEGMYFVVVAGEGWRIGGRMFVAK